MKIVKTSLFLALVITASTTIFAKEEKKTLKEKIAQIKSTMKSFKAIIRAAQTV